MRQLVGIGVFAVLIMTPSVANARLNLLSPEQTAITYAITERNLPGSNSFPATITLAPDHAFYVGEQAANAIVRIMPDGTVSEFHVPTAGAGIGGLTVGVDQNIWFIETNADKIGRLTPAGQFSEFPTPTLGSHPIDITAQRKFVFFTEGRAGKIGRSDMDGNITEFPVVNPAHYPFGISSGPGDSIFYTYRLGGIGRLNQDGASVEVPLPGRPSGFTGRICWGPGGVGMTWMQGVPAGTTNMVYSFDPAQFPAGVQVSSLSTVVSNAHSTGPGAIAVVPGKSWTDYNNPTHYLVSLLDQNMLAVVPAISPSAVEATNFIPLPDPNGVAVDGNRFAITLSGASQVAIGNGSLVHALSLSVNDKKVVTSLNSRIKQDFKLSTSLRPTSPADRNLALYVSRDLNEERKAAIDFSRSLMGGVVVDLNYKSLSRLPIPVPNVSGYASLGDAKLSRVLTIYSRSVYSLTGDADNMLFNVRRAFGAERAGDGQWAANLDSEIKADALATEYSLIRMDDTYRLFKALAADRARKEFERILTDPTRYAIEKLIQKVLDGLAKQPVTIQP